MTALEDRPGASPDGLPPLRDVIREMGLSAKKSLGQNFILDLNLTRRIARLAGPLEGRTVVEVGPGPGGLTRALLIEGAERVVVVERDDRCLPVLHAIAERYPGRLDIHMGDALAVDWPKLIGLADTRQAGVGLADTRQAGVGLADTRQAGVGPAEKTKIVANLPYGVATMLLIGWLETEPWPPWFDRMALMFQKEVAERIVAEPGSKAYGRLAVISQWRTIPKLALTLPPAAFTPPPKVASAVVEFTPRPDPQPACSVKILGQVTAAAFGQRRKMLRASLKQLTPFPELLLKEASIDPQLRGEALSVADFARLAQVVERMRGAD